ncbi:MAG TPA: hypothetical protein VK463_13590, partial [Desulfomonilaceae bacterium]|nr:hypothetical protein [Desulfomonilaceae bacterium]
QDLIFTFDSQTPVSPHNLVTWAQTDRRMRLLSGDRLAMRVGDVTPDSRISQCFGLLERLGATGEDADTSAPLPASNPTIRIRKTGGLKNV